MSPCFCRKHLAEGRAVKNFFRDAVSLAPYFLGLVRGTVKPARYTIPAEGLVIGMIPASSNDRFRKEKKMRFTLNVEDLPYDAMGDYSAFRVEFTKEVPKEEEIREAGKDPAVRRGPLPGLTMDFMNKGRT